MTTQPTILTQSKLGNLFLAVGLLSGGIYGVRAQKSLLGIGLYAAALGAGGYVLGNAITNYYSNK
jgi:hypothetical protein